MLNPKQRDFSAPSHRTACGLEQGSIAKDWDPVNSDLIKGKPDILCRHPELISFIDFIITQVLIDFSLQE